jgi:hypothetical protein
MSIAAPKTTKYQPRVGDWVKWSFDESSSVFGEIIAHGPSRSSWKVEVYTVDGRPDDVVSMPTSALTFVGNEMPEGWLE